jgi:mono/diheme cytochrome c family protein
LNFLKKIYFKLPKPNTCQTKCYLQFLLIVITGVFLVNCTNNNGSKTDDTADRDSLQESIARGAYLANNVAACFDCHSNRDFKYFAGPVTPGMKG